MIWVAGRFAHRRWTGSTGQLGRATPTLSGGHRRGRAIAAATALAGLGWASGGDLSSVGSLDDDLPQLAASLGDLPVVGVALGLDIEGAVADFQRRAPSLIDRSLSPDRRSASSVEVSSPCSGSSPRC
ncbi:MAG: hypothetical protein R2710_04390 [Acidimicrobiales bacterium]